MALQSQLQYVWMVQKEGCLSPSVIGENGSVVCEEIHT